MFYKIIEEGVITQIGDAPEKPIFAEEISPSEYDVLDSIIKNKPSDTCEFTYYLAESGVYETKERTKEEKIQCYINFVKFGKIVLEDVPEEYREKVEIIVKPEDVVDITQTAEYQAGYDQAVLDMINDGIL